MNANGSPYNMGKAAMEALALTLAKEEREHGMEYCGKALGLHGGTVEDFLRFSELVVSSPLALTDAEVQDLEAAVKHLNSQPDAQGAAAVVE